MKLVNIFIAAIILTTCSPEKKKERIEERLGGSEGDVSTATSQMPSLTEQQKKDGWLVLFNGENLDGWHFFRHQDNNSWEAGGGTLHCRPFADGLENQRADLITDAEFDNYELTWEWKVASKSNSGVIYRATEEFDQPYKSGPEYQMIDDRGADGKLEDWQKSGGCFGMYAPTSEKTKPVGEWNSSSILIKGNHVEHWLNGTKTLAYDFQSPDWKKRKAAGKWSDAAGYGKAGTAHIDLQDHSSEAWFRKIYIKKL